jgi:hypothetical protein
MSYGIAVRNQHLAATLGPTDSSDYAAIALFFAFAALEAYLPEAMAIAPPEGRDGRLVDREIYRRALDVRNRKTKNQIERQYAGVAPATLAARASWYHPCKCLRLVRNALIH